MENKYFISKKALIVLYCDLIHVA